MFWQFKHILVAIFVLISTLHHRQQTIWAPRGFLTVGPITSMESVPMLLSVLLFEYCDLHCEFLAQVTLSIKCAE